MITVENLSFTYRKSKRAVLHDFFAFVRVRQGIWTVGKEWRGKVYSSLSDVRVIDS